MTGTGTVELALLPPQRQAVILSQARREKGLDVVEVAQRSGGQFSPKFLDEVERGRTSPDLKSLRALQDLYGVGATAAPSRNELVLDLNEQQLRVGSEVVDFDSPTTDNILERYVSMLYVLRNATPGTPLPLRDKDIVTLTDAFSIDPDELQRQVDLSIEHHFGISKRSGTSKKMMALIAAALTSLGVAGFALLDGSVEQVQPLHTQDSSLTETASGILIPASALTSTSATSTALSTNTVVEPQLAGAPVVDVVTSEVPADELAPAISIVADAAQETSAELASQETPVELNAVELAAIGAQIEQRVPFDIEQAFPGWAISYEAESVRYAGLTNSRTRTITMFVGASTDLDFAAEVLVHELGHAADLDKLDDELRAQWLEMRSIPPVWWAESGFSDFEVGSGDFAEAVSALVMNSPSDSAYGDFTPEQLAFVAEVTGLNAPDSAN